MKRFYLGLLAVWQILLTGLELYRQKQGKCMRRAEFQELAQAVSFCGYKGTANAVCHLAATSLSSTLQAHSCATNWQAQSLLSKAQCPLRLHCPRSARPFPNPCLNPWDTTSTAHNPSCPGWFSASLVYDTSLPRPRYLPFHIHLSSTISLNPPEMLMPSWCEHKGFSILQSWRGPLGKSEETSFLCSTPGGGWNAEPVAAVHGKKRTSHCLHWRRG